MTFISEHSDASTTTYADACGSHSAKLDSSKHPCFDKNARHQYGRVHLPVAPRCNVQCNFCDRKYDCVNESRPGVTSVILQPWQAARYYAELKAADPTLTVAGIAGPGDPFANPTETLETFRLIREEDPSAILCVASNGLGLPPYVDALADLKVSHVTVTVNAVDPEIGRGVYAWIREGTEILRGRRGAERLWERQREAITRLVQRGVMVKINSILIPGVNDEHIPEIARVMAEMGVTYFNVMPLKPTPNTEFADVPPPSLDLINATRTAAGQHLEQMTHCSRCRADAAGKIGAAMSPEQFTVIERHAHTNRKGVERRYVAVASMEGLLVNQHLGEAEELLIFAPQGDTFRQVGVRKAPPAGSGPTRWEALAELLTDCRALLVNAIGPTPLVTLRDSGLRVYETEGLIDQHLMAAWNGGEVMKIARPPRGCGTGVGCKGSGTGCA